MPPMWWTCSADNAGDPGSACKIESVNGTEMMNRLANVIDGHRWEDLPGLLHQDFSCRYVHTGEYFDRDAWVRLNAEYPGFKVSCLRTASDRRSGLPDVLTSRPRANDSCTTSR